MKQVLDDVGHLVIPFSYVLILQMRRRVKQVPLAFYRATPSSLFSESDFPGWTFRYRDGGEEGAESRTSTDAVASEQNEKSVKRQRVESTSYKHQ